MNKTIILAILSLVMIGCTQDEPIPVSENTSVQKNISKMPRIWGDETLGIDTAAFKAIAQKLVMSNMPISVCEDVHQIIQNSMEAGLGEACYLKEVVNDNPKMWIPESTQTKDFFNNILKFSFTGQSSDSIYVTQEILDKVQIYWPYSENWDGETLPLITWYGERVNSTTNFAYIYTNGQLRRIRVNDEYAKDHPVWIINSARYPHSCFPTLIIEDESDFPGTGNSGLIEDEEEEDDDPKPKMLKDFNIQFHNMIMQFQQRVPIDTNGNTEGGAPGHNYIQDESEIDDTKFYKVSVRLIDVPQNLSYNFDDGDLYVTFNTAYYKSRNICYNSGIQYILKREYSSNINYLQQIPKEIINSWDPKGLDMALLVTVGCATEDTNSLYTGVLRYDIDINLNNRMLSNLFRINYFSTDDILMQRKYTREEFFSNEIINGRESINGFDWIYFIEEK